MSAHLQFGPEWMRKGPGKGNNGQGAAVASDVSNLVQDQPPATNPTTTNTTTSKGAAALGNSRRHPSLGNLSAANSGGALSLASSVTTPSPGAFSFAAAAQGGSVLSGGGGPNLTTPSSSSSSSALPHGGEGDSVRYSKRLLSLYSSERGGKASSPTAQEAQVPTSPRAGQAKKSSSTSVGVASSSDRDSRRSVSASVESFGGQPRSHSPNGEPRGLNARSVGVSNEKPGAQKPGLFQRGSSANNVPTTALSPTHFQSSRERDRLGTGIQGGVLSSVATLPAARRRKESEVGADSLRSPRTPYEESQWDQRKTNDAFTSARNRNNRTVHEDGAGSAGLTVGSGVGSNGEMIETWSKFGGRRERAPGEGPIGPPADHSGGFAKFSGYDRKRDRQASGFSKRFFDLNESKPRRQDDEHSLRDAGQGSSDVDLSKHATYVLDSLRLDDDDDEEEGGMDRVSRDRAAIEQQMSFQPTSVDWSPENQDWWYRDLSGQVQGPFKANLMQDWFAGNYFSNDLLVRRAEDVEFQALGEKLLEIGNASTPFLTPPTAYARRALTNKHDVAYEQSSPGGFLDSAGLQLRQEQPQSFESNAANPLGWPGNRDVMQHYFGSGVNSTQNSPFATPQGQFAELDGGQRLRPRTQQEQYVEMIRQKEFADQRAYQEQRAAQMASITMAQAQGRDSAALGMWGAGAMMGNEWNHHQNQLQDQYGELYRSQQQYLQQQQQQSDAFGPQFQTTWEPQHQRASNPGFQEGESNQQPSDLLQREQYEGSQLLASHRASDKEDAVNQLQHDDLPEKSPREDATALQVDPEGDKHLNQGLSGEMPASEGAEEGIPVTGEELPAPEEEDQHQVEEVAEEEEEQAPEEAWPQSPTAVEFASEPLMTDEQWAKGESPSRGKKSRRDRAKQKVDDDAKDVTSRSASVGYASGTVRTMGEEQFRRSQASGKEAVSSGSPAPLSTWLPGTANGGTSIKAAPWANSQQEGANGGGSGLSLREIQEAEGRQAEARKASRLQLQQMSATTNLVPSSGDSSLPTTMSWGLASSNNGREGSSSVGNVAAAPAWNARQAPKKTLMEIQEEERKRAVKTKEAQSLQILTKSKGYADSASKVQGSNNAISSSTPPGNSSWSVVGASGKPTPPTTVVGPTAILGRNAAKPGSSPMAQGSSSNTPTQGSQIWNNGAGAGAAGNGTPTKSSATKQAAKQLVSSSEGSTPAPSPEFVRHCKEQLKGLNVKVDDFIDMLLSFPLDPSSDVVEIIAESVYASSSTLDGRRFASDFVAKRKLDASQNRANAGYSSLSARNSSATPFSNGQALASPLRSASDVLKSSVPSNDGFGGFKVVKAKGAKKRT
ncbi:hypothetical protein CBS101457_003320 [Exobasidium rhododendri]|nr:hypothetical protein CBS101457_003320 [Exobasidium rhododendri]